MVSNWAWAMAACASGETSSRFMNSQRSSRSARTRSAGGPTYSALLGSMPPIQLGSSRICPAILSSGRTTAISRWIASIVRDAERAAAQPDLRAPGSIAFTVPTISRAL